MIKNAGLTGNEHHELWAKATGCPLPVGVKGLKLNQERVFPLDMQEGAMINLQSIPRTLQLHLLLLFTSLLLIIIPAVNKTPPAHVSEQSLHAASQFLLLVDTEEYARSWEATAEILKKMLPQTSWNQQIAKIRSFLGPIVERVQYDIAYTSNASDVPEGEYVILTFISRFELRERVIETITLMLSSDNRWQVVGYFLK
jgi:hypothetical protein